MTDRYLREIQRAGEEADGVDGAQLTSTQGALERALGNKLHLARMIHKLITLEDLVFD